MRSNRCPEGELRELSTAPNAEVFLVSGGAGCFPGGLVILTYVEYPRVCDVCVMCRRRKRAKMFKLISDQTGSDLSFLHSLSQSQSGRTHLQANLHVCRFAAKIRPHLGGVELELNVLRTSRSGAVQLRESHGFSLQKAVWVGFLNNLSSA